MSGEAFFLPHGVQAKSFSVGLDSASALWRLLQLKGVDVNRQMLRDLEGFDGSPEAMIRVLQEHGLQGRPTLVEGEELTYLDHPTLLQTQDGYWLILRGWEGRQMVLEGREGLLLVFPDEVTSELSGQALDLSPSLPREGGIWQRLGLLVDHHRSVLLQIGFAALCLQMLALLAPWFTGLVFDRALPEGAASFLNLISVGIVVVAIFRAGIGWLRQRLVLYLITRLEIAAERSFLEHLLNLPFPILQKRNLGDFLQAFSGMVVARDVLGEVFLGAVLDALLGVSYLIIMAFKLPAVTLIVVLVAGLMGLLATIVGRAQARQQTLEVEVRAKEQGYLTEMLKGIGTIKAAGAENSSLIRWMKLLRKATIYSLKRQRQGLWSEVGLEVMRQGLTVSLLIWGGGLILANQLSVGSLFSFVAMSAGFIASVLSLVKAYLALLVLRPQLTKTMEILELAPEPLTVGTTSPNLGGPILMEGVWFRYGPDLPWVIKDYYLAIELGEVHPLQGPSGFGKSTVLRLLAGLYTPERGTISIGGLEPSAAKPQILYIPQFMQLYGGSLIENLRVLSGNAPLDRILDASRSTGLTQLVQKLPMGLQTILSHRGGTLSGGQRQLIAITAALAAEKPLLLLDEPMANLDAQICRELYKLLNRANRTICLASHV